jgi:hypothetical protein
MKSTKTDWSKVKIHTFSLRGMIRPTEIIDYVESLGIKYYCYALSYNGVVIMILKYGKSVAETTRPGERIYRQIGHLSSWGIYAISGMNGIDFICINERFKEITGFNLDHNNITVTIYDFDNYGFNTINPNMEVEKAECELIENHRAMHSILPIGNEDHDLTKNFCKKSAPSREAWESCFENFV